MPQRARWQYRMNETAVNDSHGCHRTASEGCNIVGHARKIGVPNSAIEHDEANIAARCVCRTAGSGAAHVPRATLVGSPDTILHHYIQSARRCHDKRLQAVSRNRRKHAARDHSANVHGTRHH